MGLLSTTTTTIGTTTPATTIAASAFADPAGGLHSAISAAGAAAAPTFL
jgi:hypothetical protein